MFKIRKGTKCYVRNIVTGTDWQPFVTTKDSTFIARWGVDDSGGRWVFSSGNGWLLKVAVCFVVRIAETPPSRQSTFNQCILGRNGKGSNRRRNRRR